MEATIEFDSPHDSDHQPRLRGPAAEGLAQLLFRGKLLHRVKDVGL